MAKKPKQPIENLDEAKLARFGQVLQDAVDRFDGQTDELEAALGMYALGHYVGWKVLVLVHSKKTIRKYEQILGITVREEFPEEGSQSHRSRALSIAKTLSNFWKAVSGEDKSIDRTERKLLEGH
jgi:hypothetical protein